MDATERLLYAIGDYCRVFGISPRRVEIWTYDDKEQAGFAMPVPAKFYMEALQQHRQAPPGPPQQAPTPAPPQPQAAPVGEDTAAGREYLECVADIIALLRAKRFPLSATRILFEFGEAGKTWRQGLVVKCLRDMTADGTVENPADARRKGYRLPPEPAPEEAEEN